MSEKIHPFVALTDAALQVLLGRAVRNTVILGLVPALVLWIASGWRNALMLLIGAAISAASILEWQRLIRLINAKIDNREIPRGAFLAVLFFMLRLIVFAGAIYVSLKYLQGSVVALLCGLALAVVAVGWEALKLLRD
jgi:hypothetical protein